MLKSIIFLFLLSSCYNPQVCGLNGTMELNKNEYTIVITRGEKSRDTNSKTATYNLSQGNIAKFTTKKDGKFASKPFTKEKEIEINKYNEISDFLELSGLVEHTEINKAENISPIHYIRIKITSTINGRVQKVFSYFNTQKDFNLSEDEVEKNLKKLMDKLETNTGFLMNVY